MNNRYQEKPEVYSNQKNIPTDVIKPIVEEKPSFDRLVEMMKKRYRGTLVVSVIDSYMKAATLKAAFDKILAQHVHMDGHERNIILTAEELTDRRRQDNIKGIVGAIATVLKGTGDHKEMVAAVSRQFAMRKLKNMYTPSAVAEWIIRKLKDDKIIALKSNTVSKTVWVLVKPIEFMPPDYAKFVGPFDLI